MKNLSKFALVLLSIFSILMVNVQHIKAADKTILLVYKSTLDTSFDIEIDITATHSKRGWTGVTQLEPIIDSNAFLTEYTISNNTLSCKVSSKSIRLTGGFTIDAYFGIGPARIKLSSNKFSIDKSFLASKYIK